MPQANTLQANVNDRRSIERVYPPDAFARDAAENDRHRIEILKGVRVASAPDGDGNFALEPGAQYTGEVPGTLFLAPFHRRTAEENASDDPDPRHGYDAFIDEIIEAARRHGYQAAASPGPDDPRLRGARQ
jgi:hypothetical protein